MVKRLIITADDFGLSQTVNEAVEQAYSAGILTSASLMVGAPAAADAVRRARAMPGLAVGLHLVVIEGAATLPPPEIPALVDARGWFPSDGFRLGLRYAFSPAARRQLAHEIEAQFAAFAATGLALDHADAHKHMHLHPTVGRLMVDIGRRFGLRAIRVPAEPPHIMRRCGEPVGIGAQALYRWSGILRRQAAAGGLVTNDRIFGIAGSGAMTAERIIRYVAALPAGTTEIYLHPAAQPDPVLRALMPAYRHEAELAALLDPGVARALAENGVIPSRYAVLAGSPPEPPA